MSCCCEKVYRMCDQVVCDGQDLVLPVTILVDGNHTLELEFLGDVIRQEAPHTTGDAATFSKADLNEKFTYVGRVLDPSGAVVKFTQGGQEYDCFEFTTKRALGHATASGVSS